jgi:succinate-semialdehyde dehydrogenase/glutarate-semialdehyde dehydrogenase
MLDSINPATGELIKTYESHHLNQVESTIEAAATCFQKWRASSMKDRSALFRKLAAILLQRKEEYGRIISLEMGKVYSQSLAEIEKCAWACEYFAEEAPNFLQDLDIQSDFKRSFVTYQPLGVILGIMPWNFPFWQVFRFAIPTMMAGNVCLVKHASNVSGCALAIEQAFCEAGFPAGCMQVLLLPSRHVHTIIQSPLVKGVSLTGSTEAGKAVGQIAGECLKKTVLELGGSDPYIILADANVDEAVEVCSKSRLNNVGQSCIAAKRFIVDKTIARAFAEKMARKFEAAVMGDPFDSATMIGPLARQDLRDHLHQQVAATITQGAQCLFGGKDHSGPGAFYPPTVLYDVRKGMIAYREELFGPVASIIVASDEQEAIQIANDTSFGLGAAIFTQDLKKGERLAREEIHAGSVFVNAMVRSDPRLPFGGIKESGYGRELSVFGIREFVNIKTIAL